MKKELLSALIALPAIQAINAAPAVTPLTYEDPKYVRDWYAPPPEWTPATGIMYYNGNTRVSEIVWVEYKGANAPGLKIFPISKEKLKTVRAHLATRVSEKEVPFDLKREEGAATRSVAVEKLQIPNAWASEFTNISFKVKSKVRNAGSGLTVEVPGAGLFKTAECKDVRREGDVTEYSFPIEKRGRSVNGMRITVDPITAEDFEQEITVFDLHIKCAKSFAPFKSPAPREFVQTGESVEERALPVRGWAPKEGEPGNGVKTEVVTEKIGDETLECLRITWTRNEGEKSTGIAKLPFEVNALDWNTLSFLYKVEVSGTGKYERCEGKILNKIPQYFMFNRYVDNIGVSFASDSDCYDWNECGVTRTYTSEGRLNGGDAPEGWTAFKCDMVNDDPVGNKWFTLDKITSFEFTHTNKMLAPGDKVVFTVAKPKLTRGLTYAGGDMKLWEEFKKWKSEHAVRSYAEALKDNPFDAAKLEKPVEAMKDGIADIEIINMGRSARNPVGRAFAAKKLHDELIRVLNPVNDIPIYENKGTTNDNVKIYLGFPDITSECTGKLRELRKQHGKSIATVIANEGKNFYFIGTNDTEPFGEDKGIMNAVLDFLEGNFGLIWPRPVTARGKNPDSPRFPATWREVKSRDYSFTWGSYWVNVPALKSWGFSNGSDEYSFQNRASYFGCWYNMDTFNYSSYRVFAANHWFGFGGGKEENEKWGLVKGKRLRPGCYTSTPCLINILEDAKEDYFRSKLVWAYQGLPEREIYRRFNDDSVACWIEDTWQQCECEKCMRPFRLPDGTLITADDPDFHAEATYVNANAYMQMIRTYLNRSSKLNYLIYFYTIPVPRTPLSRYIRAHFAPYVRVNYDIPIYAPVNDKFWRVICQWSQVADSMGVSEYFLGGNFRPSADVQSFDIEAYRQLGVEFFGQETEQLDGSFTEMWCSNRKIYMPGWDADSIRAYYCRNVYGEGAEQMYDFFAKIRALRYTEHRDTDFEETGWSELGRLAIKTKSDRSRCDNLAEELDMLIDKAFSMTSGDARANFYVGKVRVFWKWYYENAKKEVKGY